MFKLGTIKISEQVNSNKNLLISNNNISINNYHETRVQLTKSTPKGDYKAIAEAKNKVVLSHSKSLTFKDKINFINSNIIENNINNFKMISDNPLVSPVKKVFDISLETYEMALQHDCFYDIISRDEVAKIVTVAFLPFSTSNNIVICGLQKFQKIHINTNIKGFKDIYITRLLFHKTMTEKDYDKGVLESKYGYQNKVFRKAIFNEIQKDLENNHYSLLKDTDLYEGNVEFFKKELPLVKFKFTDLEF